MDRIREVVYSPLALPCWSCLEEFAADKVGLCPAALAVPFTTLPGSRGSADLPPGWLGWVVRIERFQARYPEGILTKGRRLAQSWGRGHSPILTRTFKYDAGPSGECVPYFPPGLGGWRTLELGLLFSWKHCFWTITSQELCEHSWGLDLVPRIRAVGQVRPTVRPGGAGVCPLVAEGLQSC